MGREVRRVPLDFDWPLNKVWEGFLNPHYKKCPHCAEGTGGTYDGKIFEHFLRLLFLAADPTMNRERLHPQLVGFIDRPGGEELYELAKGLSGGEPSFLGFCSTAQYRAAKKILEAAGMPEKWGWCKKCDGSGMDPACKEAYDKWESEDHAPPKGPGYQLWETVSEGSPVSPVFATLDEFVNYLIEEEHMEPKQARKFSEIGWAPSFYMDSEGIHRGMDIIGKNDE